MEKEGLIFEWNFRMQTKKTEIGKQKLIGKANERLRSSENESDLSLLSSAYSLKEKTRQMDEWKKESRNIEIYPKEWKKL